jgi:hypothetical protein
MGPDDEDWERLVEMLSLEGDKFVLDFKKGKRQLL